MPRTMSKGKPALVPPSPQSSRWIVLELSLIYSLIQIYIWRWQSTWPRIVGLILLLLLNRRQRWCSDR